jgi:hypothetical protein
MNGQEKLIITNDVIEIVQSHQNCVMHIGEKPLMKKLAEIVTQNGGDILEIGFGLHLSADFIQSTPTVTSHTIIEIHPEIYEIAVMWVKNKPNTKIILGDWFDVIPTLTQKFDGILHDSHEDINLSKFLDMVIPLSNKNCIVGFFQHLEFDERLSGIRVPIDINEYNTIPYKNNPFFNLNQYELLYSKFDGEKYHNETITTHII